ncbi:MAG: acetate--CoA ligase family protein [Alphaproteobacteria bacterium]
MAQNERAFKRGLYGRAELERLINPSSVAVAGASATVGSFGHRTAANLAPFKGSTYLINPRYEEIEGKPCYPSLKALPVVPDCVICTLPRDAVEPLVEESASLGVGGVIVYASGYAETGIRDRIALQARLAAMVRGAKTRLMGPNTIGFYNVGSGAAFTFNPETAVAGARPGPLGLVSQSGALGFAIAQVIKTGVSFSHILTCGNQCDVDALDLANYLVENPETRAIACMLEGVPDGERLIELGYRGLAADKPIVMYKTGTGKTGAEAVRAHTGSLVGSNDAYAAAFARTGIIGVDAYERLVETAYFFAKAPRPDIKKPGVAIISGSGGAGIVCADKAELHGVPLPKPRGKTRAVLRSIIPEFGSANNPVDVTAQSLANPESYRRCVSVMRDDPDYGCLVVPQTVANADVTPFRARVLSEIAREAPTPIIVPWMSGWREGPGSETFEANPDLSVFRSLDSCFAAIAAWHWRERIRQNYAKQNQARRAKRLVPAAAASKVRSVLAAGSTARGLTARDSRTVLAAYGIPVLKELRAATATAAVAAAKRIGYPVAILADAPDLSAAAQARLARFDLAAPSAVRRAFAEVMAAARAGQRTRAKTKPDIQAVIVQQMAPIGLEFVISARRDPQFGPLVAVGIGGPLVEILPDAVLALAPIGRAEAKEMLASLPGYALLVGHRDDPGVKIDAVVNVICRVSELAYDLADMIDVIDVSPIASSKTAVAAGALIVKRNHN